MGMKVHSSQMAGGVVTFVIPFPRLASFTIGKEAFIRRGIDGHPDLTGLPVYPVRMSAQLVFTAEAIGIIIASRALQTQYFPMLYFPRTLECRRCCCAVNEWSHYDRFFGRSSRVLGFHRGASMHVFFHLAFAPNRGHMLLLVQTTFNEGVRLQLA